MRRLLAKLMPGSLEGTVSLVTALILVATVLCVWIARWAGRDNVALHHAMSLSRMVVELLLALAVPLVVYWCLRWWNQTEAALFPDIDEAWKAGMDALAGLGVAIDTLPVFLVLGTTDSTQERQFMAGAVADLRIQGVPHDPNIKHALHWYVTSEAVYLFCTHTSVLSTMARQWAKNRPAADFIRTMPPQSVVADRHARVSQHTPRAERGQPDNLAGAGGEADQKRAGGRRDVNEKIVGDSVFVGSFLGQPVSIDEPKGRAGPEPLAENMAVVETHSEALTEQFPPVASSASSASSASMTVPPLRGVEQERQLERLKHVCQLLRRARSPHCGINGILALFPIEVSAVGERELDDLSSVARKDVEAAQDVLSLLAPVTAMVVGFERETGFAEFFLRLPTKYRNGRLGSGFELETYPTSELLNEHSDRLCDHFEDRIYDLLRGRDAIAGHRGNRKLYNLLCRIRHHLKPNLRIVLGKAFGCASAPQPREDGLDQPPFLFGGCYFAAIGGVTGGSAFTGEVLSDKLLSEQEKVQWAASERQRHFLLRIASWIGWGVCLMALVGLICQFWWRMAD